MKFGILRFARRSPVLTGAFLALFVVTPGFAGKFNKPVPDWGLEAAKTKTPENAKDASAVILFDEYVETVDDKGRATEREREAIRILKPQGRGTGCEVSCFDVDEKVNYFRVWTIGADEKQYPAQETDFIDQGDTDIPIMLSTRKVPGSAPACGRCGRGNYLRIGRADGALHAGEGLEHSEWDSGGFRGAGG